MILDLFGRFLQKKLEKKKREIVRLRWEEAQLREILRKVQQQDNSAEGVNELLS